jgi:hypothetical protein
MDNLAGYVGCIAVLGVAFLPCTANFAAQPCLIPSPSRNPLVGSIHNLSALLYFLVLIVYSLLLFPKTHLDRITGEKMFMRRQKRRRNVMYYICGSVMSLSLVLIIAYMWFLGSKYPGLKDLNPIFWLETVMLIAFGISWLTKGQLFFKDEHYHKGP